jgi:hypothetical protein
LHKYKFFINILFSLQERMSEGQVRVFTKSGALSIKLKHWYFCELPHPAFSHLLPKGEGDIS